MTDTLPNILVNELTYSDIYFLSSINVGTQVVLQNKGPNELLLAISSTEPSINDRLGIVIPVFQTVNIDAGHDGLWAISTGGKCKVLVWIA